MAHLIIQYSANLAAKIDQQALCDRLHKTMVDKEFFPLGGIRVRTIEVAHYAIADKHSQNGFVDMVLRMGAGRSVEQKTAIGEALVKDSKDFFETLLAEPYFALSLEVLEIDNQLSWKVNSIHPRLK